MLAQPKPATLLFFTRGRGRGHAVADVAIAEEVNKISPATEIKFVSYAAGADTIEQLGHEVFDLALPADNPVLETLVRVGHTIGWAQPTLVVAHEEFMALPAAKMFQIPTTCITDWFAEERSFVTQTLLYADEILFTDETGIFEEPAVLAGKVHYLGPALREFSYGPEDRLRARAELGMATDAVIISVLPGSWPESTTPIFDLVTQAFQALPETQKNLVWIAAGDYEELGGRLPGSGAAANLQLKRQDWQIDRLMVASDLVLTKASRETHKELNALGVRSISLSFGLNAPDDVRAAKFAGNTALDARSVTPGDLTKAMQQILNSPTSIAAQKIPSSGRRLAAEHLMSRLDDIRQ